ncbi:hypothetical protein [Streptomyces collinus]|uniref:hypothetical protein n=1 Tax=Streptomyces collinus TaxID=42684 RepID=UPI003642A0AE
MSGTAGDPPLSSPTGGTGGDALARPLVTGVTRLVVGLADIAAQTVTAARPRYPRPGRPGPLGDAVLGLALEVQRRSVSAVADTADRAGNWARATTRLLVPPTVLNAVDRRVAYWSARGAAERERAANEARPLARAVVRALTAAVVDEIDLDAVTDRLDVDRVARRIDLDAVLAGLDLDAVLARVDLDALLARVDVDTLLSRVDLDAVADRLDVDRVAGRIDPDALLARLDLDAVLARVDLDAVLARVDVDALLARVDLDAVADRLDVDRVARRLDLDAVLARVDLATYTERVLEDLDVGRIVRDTGGSITAETLDTFREQNARADRFVDRIAERLLHRGGPDGDGPGPPPAPPPGGRPSDPGGGAEAP